MIKFEVVSTEEPLGDILQNRLEQLGPALDDAETAAYASILLQTADPVAEPTSRAYAPAPSAGEPVVDEETPNRFGPAVDDEEAAGYMGHFLA